MSDDFEWSAANEDIVQHSVQGVAAYINQYGNITIRQERGWDDDQDTIVVLTVESARRLAEKLKELINSYQA
ncbi:MAG TPA: hypothetical protein VGC56_14175 [Allosphingosinicella sp.]|jgi:hypothetical protein